MGFLYRSNLEKKLQAISARSQAQIVPTGAHIAPEAITTLPHAQMAHATTLEVRNLAFSPVFDRSYVWKLLGT